MTRGGFFGAICLAVLSALAGPPVAAQLPGEAWHRIGILSGDISAIGISPAYESDHTLYAGVAGAGLWRSTNAGQTWTHLESVANNATVTAILFASDYRLGFGARAYVGTDSGLVYSSTTDFDTYTYRRLLTYGGLPYAVSSGCLRDDNELFWGTSGGGIFLSTDYGNSYTNLSLEMGVMLDCRALAASPATRQVLAACVTTGGGGPVFQWGGSQQIWNSVGPAALETQIPTALHIAKGAPSRIYLGTESRGLWTSSDQGASWAAACDGSTTAQTYTVNAVAACPNFGGTIPDPSKACNPSDPTTFMGDFELLEGRSDGLRFSSDAGGACLEHGVFGPVTALAYAPHHHLPEMDPCAPRDCDLFVGTTSGLLLRSCLPQAPPTVTPPAVSVDRIALAFNGPPGTWAGGSLGLLRNSRERTFLQFSASGAFGNQNPQVAALCVTHLYRADGACGTDEATAFLAEKTLGVFKTQDHGATWRKLDLNVSSVPTWPAGVTVNDLAIAPNYGTGQPNRDVLYAATSRGLYRWDGELTGWSNTNPDLLYNVTRVALPPTYDKTGAAGGPRHLVVFATPGYFDPNLGRLVGLRFSPNDGATHTSFNNVGDQYIQAIAFTPGYWSTGAGGCLFLASPANRAMVTSVFPEDIARFCTFNDGLTTGVLRDLDVAPVNPSAGVVRLAAATSDGPFYCDFDPFSDTANDCNHVNYAWNEVSPWSAPSGCRDTLSVGFAYRGDGGTVALGTSQDGVFFSGDAGVTYGTSSDGYRSLPDDVYNVLPHARDDRVLFASSPTYGVFVSRDKGRSFRPWNAGGAGGPCVLTQGWGLGMMPDRIASGSDVVWVGGNSGSASTALGIQYRPIAYDTTNGVQLDGDHWFNTTQTTGRFERFETLGLGQANKARATSPTLGFFFTAANDWFTWTADNGGLTALDAKSVRYGYDGADPGVLANGVTVADSVGEGLWKYYSFVVPSGALDFHVFLDDPDDLGAVDPDLYLRNGALPNTSTYDYRPHINGDEEVCVTPVNTVVLAQDFNSAWGTYGDNPPTGWTIVDEGDESPKVWNNNDWYRSTYAMSGVARVSDSSTEHQTEYLISPSFDIPALPGTVALRFYTMFDEKYPADNGSVLYRSDQHTAWTTIHSMSDTAFPRTVSISLLAYKGDTNAQVAFFYDSPRIPSINTSWWVDDVAVTASQSGTWWVGIHGSVPGANAYELTATMDSGCTASKTPQPGAGKTLGAAARAILRPLPEPLAPAGGAIWGTVSRSDSGGVFRGFDSAPFAGLSGEPAPAATTWEARNGSGAGALTNLNAQSVLQLPDLSLVTGCNGGVFYSPAPDEGRTTWIDASADVVAPCSLNFTDLLSCSNGDVLIAAHGTTDGGAWLSGDKGHHWMRISDGFDSTSQELEDLVSDGGLHGEVSYYASTDSEGAYTRTITAMPYPTVTSLSSASGAAGGGETITVTGTGFSDACPTGDPGDCPPTGPVVLFDEIEATTTTFVSATSLTCVVPPHPVGAAVVTVRNRDTRRGGARAYTFACAAPSSLPVILVTDEGGCADSGVTVTWAADPGNWGDGEDGTRTYDVLRDGSPLASDLAYGTGTFTDTSGINGTTYTYRVRYRNGCGLTAPTGGESGTDSIAPGVPLLEAVTDANPFELTGVRITYTAGEGASVHELWRDGAKVLDSYESGALYAPGDADTHSYVVRAVSGSCGVDSSDAPCADERRVPPEVSNDSFKWTSKTSLTWSPIPGVPGYHVYRGVPDALGDLPYGGEVCLDSGDWASPPATVRSDVPSPGTFYWYLVTAHNDLGEDGSAGSGRLLNWTGDACSAP